MKLKLILYTLLGFSFTSGYSQTPFDYSLQLEPLNVTGFPGLHSYAYAQHEGKWLFIGGRLDGLHPRQPFNSFPALQNNTSIYVVDVVADSMWVASITTLPSSIKEQLQSTNMNFFQERDTLYIVGGYAYSTTAADHITFPYLTTVNVSHLIDAVVSGGSIQSLFKQISDSVFAVTGGHLNKLGDEFYLVGGHRFDGRYNPMGHATYVQAYTNQIRKFKIDNSQGQLSFSDYSAVTDAVHLHRRDYNLLPQIFPNGDLGFTISSGVFQTNVDLPYLYPVDVTATGYQPVTSFNQYLSNYHSASVALFDSSSNEMHSLFFGGISQYYYQNGALVADQLVPFVNTISRVSRNASGALTEYQLAETMPALKGASAEFIYNKKLPHYSNEVIKLNNINVDTILIGHIVGGIYSTMLNPFDANSTGNTSADNSIYAVKLIRTGTPNSIQRINGENPYDLMLWPNPTHGKTTANFTIASPVSVNYFLTNSSGQIVLWKDLNGLGAGKHAVSLNTSSLPAGQYNLTFVFEGKFFVSKKLLVD